MKASLSAELATRHANDVGAHHAALVERGDVTIASAIEEIACGARSFYTVGPDGVPVEFVQVPRS
jgi:hypothetical protein